MTHEDCLALVFVTLHRNKSIAALTIRHAMCLESDRRDAELMLQYVQCTVPKGRHAQIGGECGWFAGQTQL